MSEIRSFYIADRRTSRSKRKMERKVGSGRKGTVDEEEYLLKSINKLVDRFNVTLGKVVFLKPSYGIDNESSPR